MPSQASLFRGTMHGGVLVVWLCCGGTGLARERYSFATPEVRLDLDAAGRVVSLVARGGRDLLRGGPEPFILLRAAGRMLAPTGLRQVENGLVVHFGAGEPRAFVRVRSVGRVLLVKTRVTPTKELEAVEFARLPVAVEENVGSTLATRWDDDFGVVLVPGHETVETVSSRNGVMSGAVHRDFGMGRAIVAVVAAPTPELDRDIEAAERALGIPSPRLGGMWAKRAPAVRRSYLFADVTERNVDEMIAWAHRGSLTAVMLYARTWAETAGSYRINRTSFPNGERGLAATVGRLQAAGLTVGLHCMTSLVAKRDPLGAPRPDERLLKDGASTLVEEVGSDDAEMVVMGATGILPRSTEQGGGTDVQIDDEIIRYQAVESMPGDRRRITGCERGANGTLASSHRAGSAVRHLAERHGAYLADLRTSLPLEIAERLAGVIERAGFDLIYLDAGEVNDANGPAWYWRGRQQEEILRRVSRPLLVQGSGITAWTWHRFTRGTCDDGVVVGRDAWLEVHKIGRVLPVYRRNRMPAELGWWRLDDDAIGRPRTAVEDAELLGRRSVELELPFSVETTAASLRGNPDSIAILETLGQAERARVGGTASEWRSMRAASTPGPAEPDEPEPQSLRLLDGEAHGEIRLPVPAEPAVGQLAAWFPLGEPHDALARGGRPGPAGTIDLSRHGGLAVTIGVDGRVPPDRPAPVLNVQLETTGGRYRDYLLDVDFQGERTVVVREPSADRVIRELPPEGGTYRLKDSLYDADLSRTRALNVRWMRGAGSSGVAVRVRRVDAVPSPSHSLRYYDAQP